MGRWRDQQSRLKFLYFGHFENIFINNPMAKHFLEIDQTLGVLGHNAVVCGSAQCQLTPRYHHVSTDSGRIFYRGPGARRARRELS